MCRTLKKTTQSLVKPHLQRGTASCPSTKSLQTPWSVRAELPRVGLALDAPKLVEVRLRYAVPLSAGMQFGAHRITAPLGAGGMGEVYRARDLKLGRDVAIKVLPAMLAGDAQHMARSRASRNCWLPSITPTLPPYTESSRTRWLWSWSRARRWPTASPVVRCPSTDRIPDHRRPKAAHDSGVVHRDLKPANVKFTPAGVVKLLDFGSANAADEASSPAGQLATSPTLSMAMTAAPDLGTATYMSPEQARGKPIAAVVTREPDWNLLPPARPRISGGC